MLRCVRFHKRDPRSPGSPCRSVQGGITIFSHAACLETQGGGSKYLEGMKSNLEARVKVTGQTFQSESCSGMITDLIRVLMRGEYVQSICISSQVATMEEQIFK